MMRRAKHVKRSITPATGRLMLSKETIRTLASEQLRTAVAGAARPTESCLACPALSPAVAKRDER